jgi:hypothetical protein
MANDHRFFDFKRGDIVNANGEIAVVLDVLRSTETPNVCIYVRFIRNIGNSRTYVEVTPELTKGVDKWKPATVAELQERLSARRDYLNREIEGVLQLVGGGGDLPNTGR